MRGPLAWLVIALVAWSTLPVSAAEPLEEYEIKAAFLYRFAQFVTWPEEAFESQEAPLIVAVGGHDPFGRILERTIAGKTVKGRSIEVRRYKRASDLAACHILFIASEESGASWLQSARRRPRAMPLTVGETDAFWRDGGVIAFTIEQKRIRFAINTGAAEGAGLRISSKLLSLARLVGDQGQAEGW